MIIVGLTGSIASGKSTVSETFKELGAYVIDWDILAREVVRPHQRAWNGIVDYFGRAVLNEDLTLNRQKLGEIVFRDAEKLEKLNQITHPAVIEEDEEQTEEIGKLDPNAIVIKDVPLLIEIGFHKRVDKVVVVYASRENQIKRMMASRGLSSTEATQRIEAQMPLREKIRFADFVIQNDGSVQDTGKQVEEIFAALKALQT
ncbi:MAG: dephospho-CoA kinase [Dehalococcoidia bacterium]|nr:dephospho-CoA kinase [Dehalococcoidia bacterium]